MKSRLSGYKYYGQYKRRFHGNHCIHLMLPTSCKGNCLILARKRQFTDLNLKHTKGSNSFLSDGNRNYLFDCAGNIPLKFRFDILSEHPGTLTYTTCTIVRSLKLFQFLPDIGQL